MSDTVVKTYKIKKETDEKIQKLGDHEKRRWAGIVIDEAVEYLYSQRFPEPISIEEELARR